MWRTFVESSDRLDDLITNSWNYCGFIGNLCLKHKILNFSNSIGSSQFYSSAQQCLSGASGGQQRSTAIIPKSQVRTRGNGYISLQLRPYNTKLSSSNISYPFMNNVHTFYPPLTAPKCFRNCFIEDSVLSINERLFSELSIFQPSSETD